MTAAGKAGACGVGDGGGIVGSVEDEARQVSSEAFAAITDTCIADTARASASAAARNFSTVMEVGGGFCIAVSEVANVSGVAPGCKIAGVVGRRRPSSAKGSEMTSPGFKGAGFGVGREVGMGGRVGVAPKVGTGGRVDVAPKVRHRSGLIAGIFKLELEADC